MTQNAIQEQIKALKSSTNRALQSKQSAQRFLIQAGILKTKQEVNSSTKSSLIKKK